MATIYANVNSINSVSGLAYTDDQLVLYSDISEPTGGSSGGSSGGTAKTVSASCVLDYTQTTNSSNQTYWTITNSSFSATLSEALPFDVYFCIIGSVHSASSAYSSYKKIRFYVKIAAGNTTSSSFTRYQGSASTSGSSWTTVSGIPINSIYFVTSSFSCGMSKTLDYKQNTSVSQTINYTINTNSGTTT